jgi:hypothetical protein
MSSEVRCTTSGSRPRIIQNKKLSKASEKKGVQFDSSYTSSDDDTSKTDEASITESEREEVIIRTSSGNYTRVKIPHNVKNNLLHVQVKLFDISYIWKCLIDFSSQLNTNRKTFLRNMSGTNSEGGLSEARVSADDYEQFTYGSGGRTNSYKGPNTTSEELGSCPSTSRRSVGNAFQEMSPYEMYIKEIVKLENPDDTAHISVSNASIVMAPEIQLLGKYGLQENEDIADVKQECDVGSLRDTFSVKEDTHEHDIYSDGENGLLRCSTENGTKNAIVRFPSDSDTENGLWGRSESNTAPDERKGRFQSDLRGSLYRRKWNKSTQRQRLEKRMPHPHSTQEAITKLTPRLRKRNRAHTELINSLRIDSDSSADSSVSELNRTNKRMKCYSKENSMSTDSHNLPHLGCTNYIDDMGASQAHGRKDEKTLRKGCNRNLDKACHDRLSTSVQSAQTNMRVSEVGCAQLSSCSDDNKSQVYSGDGDVESRRTSRRVACSRGVTLNRETRIMSEACAFLSTEALLQAVVAPGLTKKKGEKIVPCDTTCNRMEIVRGTQSRELSFYTCTSSEEQSEVASTKSEKISNLKGAKDSITGGSRDVICLPENNQVISHPEHSKSDLPFLSADEKTQELHGKYTEKNSRKPQTIQHFNHSSISSDSHDMSQMDPQKHDVGIQCELLSDRGLSGFCHSHVCCAPIKIHAINDSANISPENPVGITNLSQEVEVFTTESGAMNSSRQSNESEGTDIAKKKQSSPELMSQLYRPSNDPSLGSPSSTVTMHDTHVDKSYSLGKESDSNNSASKNNTIILASSVALVHERTIPTDIQDNIYCGTDTAVQGTDQSAANVIAHESSKNDSRNNQDVRKTLHSVRDSNRTVTTDNEVSWYSESLKCKPSTDGMDRNYWTNGNRTPFAMAEVFLAAKQISSQKGKTHKIGPHHDLNISESSRNMHDEDRNQQQIHKAMPVFNLECSTQQEKQSMALSKHHLRAEQRKVYCFNDTEEVHTVTGRLSGRLSPQDRLSNSSRGNNAQLHLYTAGEPLIASSPCSSISNISTTCEETVSDYENVLKTEATTDMLSENGEKVVALETPEESVDLLHDWGTESEIPEMSDGLLGVNKVDPETSQQSGDQLLET